MDADPLPPLLSDDIRDTAVDNPCRPENRIPVLEEALQNGGGSGDAKNMACVRKPDPVDSGVTDSSPAECSIDRGRELRSVFVVQQLYVEVEKKGSYALLEFAVEKSLLS